VAHTGEPDPGCAGIVRDVIVLGGVVEVPEVEAINRANQKTLFLYTRGESIQSQLSPNGNFGFVAVLDEKVVGFVALEKRSRFLNVLSIAVSSSAREQGVGRDLMAAVLREATKMQGILDVRVLLSANDTDSQGFFSHVGLKQTEVIPQKFENFSVNGLLFKALVKETTAENRQRAEPVPQLQPQLQPKPQRKQIALAVLEATFEEILALDPTLEHARD